MFQKIVKKICTPLLFALCLWSIPFSPLMAAEVQNPVFSAPQQAPLQGEASLGQENQGLPDPQALLSPEDSEGDMQDLYLVGAAGGDLLHSRLPRFGRAFFSKRSSGGKQALSSVGDSYVVQTGDQVHVALWGLEEGQWTLTVDREGYLNLPRAGFVQAAGVTFKALQNIIYQTYAKYYTNFDINVSMGQVGDLTVYVAGRAERPGSYVLPRGATMLDALIAAGGPSLQGSSRKIQLKRRDRVLSTFDTYDLLLRGDASKAAALLQEGDVIFVPPVGPLVAITGKVTTPGVYELSGPTSLNALFAMAGGVLPSFFRGRVQVLRVYDNEYRGVFEEQLRGGNQIAQELAFSLRNGDMVRLFGVPAVTTSVKLSGAVVQPGSYAIRPGETRLSDVLARAGGLLYMASHTGEITRVSVTQQGPVTERFTVDLQQALSKNPESDPLLQINDFITVRQVPEWDLYDTVRVQGEVRSPGTYAFTRGERISDLLERAQGFTPEAFAEGAVFVRQSVYAKQKKALQELADRLERSLFSQSTSDIMSSLNPSDVEALKSGTAYQQSLIQKIRQIDPSGRVVVDIPQDYRLLKGSPFDLELQEGDRLLIPRRTNTVQVVGSLMNPSSTFVFQPNRPYTHYVKLAGGYEANADRARAYILRADGSAVRAIRHKKALPLEEGDTLVIPQKLQVLSSLHSTRDIIDIMYKVAVTAGVIINAFD